MTIDFSSPTPYPLSVPFPECAFPALPTDPTFPTGGVVLGGSWSAGTGVGGSALDVTIQGRTRAGADEALPSF